MAPVQSLIYKCPIATETAAYAAQQQEAFISTLFDSATKKLYQHDTAAHQLKQ